MWISYMVLRTIGNSTFSTQNMSGSVVLLLHNYCTDCVNNTFLALRVYDSTVGQRVFTEFFLTGKTEYKAL